MDAWKPSTLLVLTAFTVSVLLLIMKGGMHDERSANKQIVVSNQIYSPAAADPELRNPERAERLRRSAIKKTPKAVATSVKTPVSAPAKTPTPSKRPVTSKKQTDVTAEPKAVKDLHPDFKPHPVPASHAFYVVMATFSSYERALIGIKEFERKGLSKSFIGNFDGGQYYSVIGDTFVNEASARLMVQTLEDKHGVQAYIYHKKEE